MKTCELSARKIYRWMRPARFNGVIVNVSWNSLSIRSERNIVSVITVYRLPLNFYNFYIDKTLYDSSEEMFKMSLQHCYTHKLFDISLIVCVKKYFCLNSYCLSTLCSHMIVVRYLNNGQKTYYGV